ncbi:MAG: hypothetical protein K6U78_03990 [Anaerolineae bacterium]|jgi:hypothetical protein|nr:hypothetical protein [Anaerolineae bacterium]
MSEQNDTPDMDNPPTGYELGELPPYISPTLASINAKARPERSTVCEVCPASVWFASEGGLKAFCRVMHLITWSNEDPNALTHCDGQVMAELERQQKAASSE